MAFSGWDEIRVTPEAKLPPLIVVISYVMNIGGVSAIVFFLLKYFVHARELAMTALNKEHRRVRHSLSLAMEVQQNLLPQADPEVEGLDINFVPTFIFYKAGEEIGRIIEMPYETLEKDMLELVSANLSGKD